MLRKGDLTQGGITTTLLQFTLPMLAGSLLQQCYNIADTLIVGQCIGANALAAVGSAYLSCCSSGICLMRKHLWKEVLHLLI